MKNFESLLAAYLVVWGIFFVYEITISRRIAQLRKEFERLKESQKK